MSEERTYTYKGRMADEKTHAACYHNDVEGIPCEGRMIYFPIVKDANFPIKWNFESHYCCQGHAYLSWGMLAGWDELNSAKRVFPQYGRKEE